jgi:hypothetical protein
MKSVRDSKLTGLQFYRIYLSNLSTDLKENASRIAAARKDKKHWFSKKDQEEYKYYNLLYYRQRTDKNTWTFLPASIQNRRVVVRFERGLRRVSPYDVRRFSDWLKYPFWYISAINGRSIANCNLFLFAWQKNRRKFGE